MNVQQTITKKNTRTEILLSEITVKDLLGKNDFLKVKSNILRKDLLQIFEKSEFTEVYFVNDNGVLLGKTKVNALLQKKTQHNFQT